MRNEEVVIAFSHRERAKSSTGSLWSTGDCLYSYSTCIAEYTKDGKLYVNLTKYSTTTSHHQTLINRHLFYAIHKFVYEIKRNRVHIVPKDERIYL